MSSHHLRERADAVAPGPELTSAFLERATRKLAVHLRAESELLELRVSGTTFSVQLRAGPESSKMVQLDYVERPRRVDAGYESRVYGPSSIAAYGDGTLEDNLFRFSEIDLKKIGGAFRIAKLAVDPEEGEIERLVVRRFLPFSEHVRARIFVRSPRIPGSIDTNEQGTPLKR